jgi:DNA-binding transcriptional LysR family regulator
MIDFYIYHYIYNDMESPNIELFKVLIAAAESSNLTRAAEKLGISQPAVSVRLKELSLQAPLPVFTYEGKRKVLTHYGRELYKIAKQNEMRMAQDFENLNRQYAAAEFLTLKIGARSELLEMLAPRLNFDGQLQFITLTSREAVDHLFLHKLDIAISYIVPDSPDIIAKKILETSPKFSVHKKFMKNSDINKMARSLQFLKDTPCITYTPRGHLLKEWTDYVGLPFDQIQIRGTAEDWRSVQALIDQGAGYGVVPGYIKTASSDVLTMDIPTASLKKYIFYALFHKDLRKIPAFKEMLEFKS